jgi:hypothetical protein
VSVESIFYWSELTSTSHHVVVLHHVDEAKYIKPSKMVVAPNESGEDDEDMGVLIYRESQLRKAEALAAAESEKKSTASSRRRTSTRKRSPVNNQGKKSLPSPQRKSALRGTKRESSSLEEGQPRKKVTKKKYVRYECSADGCTNQVRSGGVCVRHGAKVKLCSSEGCPNRARKGGVCIRHGATVILCSSAGCTNIVVKGGVCVRHGAKLKRCSSEGCTNNVVKGGVCVRHGAKVKLCSSAGCTNYARRRGVCRSHGACQAV